MSWVAAAVVGGTVVGGMMSADAQTSAANTASAAQIESSKLGVEEQRRQFDAIQKLLQPYADAGLSALTGQRDLLGLNGGGAQKSAINAIEASPAFTSLIKQGENAILANASATGGLRGGNTQSALAQFRPNVLSALIEQQFSKLGGLTSLGQNAAAGVGNAGMQTGNNVSQLLQQQGAAQAGAALAAGQGQANMWSGIGNSIGTLGMMKAMKVF